MAQTILVTGSTSGFGRLTVETLARQGHIVFAGMRAAAGKNAHATQSYMEMLDILSLVTFVLKEEIKD